MADKLYLGSIFDNKNNPCCPVVIIADSDTISVTGLGTQGNPFVLSASGSLSAGGANTDVQFNNAGAFGGSANFTWNNTTSVLTVTGQIVTNKDALINTLTVGLGLGSIGTNTAIGFSVLSSNTTGHNNTGIGYQSLKANTTGLNNVAIGSNAGAAMVNGGNLNTLIGTSAGAAMTTGNNNVFVGYSAASAVTSAGNNNTGIGTSVLGTLLGGGNNTAIGYLAMQSLTTGSSNTSIGESPHSTITTGSFNTFIGAGADSAGIVTGSYNTIIGIPNTLSDVSNTVVISDGESNIRVYSPSSGTVIIGGSTADNGYSLQLSGGLTLSATVLPGTPVNYALETDGTNLYFTVGGVRKTVTLT